jgi:hypothetical protein
MPNVTSVKSKKFVQGTHTSMISAAGTATSLNIDIGEFVNAQTVTITSTADNSGRTFVVVGTDANGAAQTSAATTGPGAGATVDVAGTWLSVTSITASGAITTDISAGVKDGLTTGTLFAGATRVRGMTGNGAAAGHINFINSSTKWLILLPEQRRSGKRLQLTISLKKLLRDVVLEELLVIS